MGSSGLPEGDMGMAGLPFGYNFSEDALIRSPPPPRGTPILDPNDDSLLGNFFTDMRSNQHSMLSYGEGLNFSQQWFQAAAPNLLGHTTSFGQHLLEQSEQPWASNYGDTYQFGQNIISPLIWQQQQQQQQQQQPPPPARQPPPSQLQLQPQSQPTPTDYHQDVSPYCHDQNGLHAPIERNAQVDAATLLTTLQSGRSNTYLSRTNSSNDYRPSPDTQPQRRHKSSFSQPHTIQVYNSSIRPARSNEPDTLFTDMVFGTQGSTAPRPAERPELQWGSDMLFARNQSYVPAQHESSEALEKKRMDAMRGTLKLASSNPNTRPSSPIGNRELLIQSIPGNPNGNGQVDENVATSPRKRRKSKAKTDGEDGNYAAQSPSKATAKKRKSKGELTGSPGSSSAIQEASGKRRKSTLIQSKPPRENLTEAQKRENHIKSEQKRRGAIKEGFDDLNFIVPNLQNGGYSKSSILNITGEWLDSLIKGNQMLDSKGKHAL